MRKPLVPRLSSSRKLGLSFVKGRTLALLRTFPRRPCHRKSEVEEISRIDLDRTYRANDLINLLRARTYPPYPSAYYVEGEQRTYIRIELLRENQLSSRSAAERKSKPSLGATLTSDAGAKELLNLLGIRNSSPNHFVRFDARVRAAFCPRATSSMSGNSTRKRRRHGWSTRDKSNRRSGNKSVPCEQMTSSVSSPAEVMRPALLLSHAAKKCFRLGSAGRSDGSLRRRLFRITCSRRCARRSAQGLLHLAERQVGHPRILWRWRPRLE